MTTGRTLLRFSSQGASLLSGRTHDPRWLRLHPQLLGADASGGWTEWIEDVDVALADAPGAADLAPAVEARIDLVADGEPGTCAQTGQHGGARRQREVGVVVDGQRIALAEAVAGEVLARDLRTIEECLHAQPEQLVLVAQVVGGGGEQVAQAEVERTAVLHDVRLAALVDDLLLELPLLLVGDADGGAQIVEEQEQARLVLAEELGGRRGEIRLALGARPRQLRPQHAEKAVADVANDLVLRHEDVPLPCQEKVLPKDVMLIRGGLVILKKTAPKSRGTGAVRRRRSRRASRRSVVLVMQSPPRTVQLPPSPLGVIARPARSAASVVPSFASSSAFFVASASAAPGTAEVAAPCALSSPRQRDRQRRPTRRTALARPGRGTPERPEYSGRRVRREARGRLEPAARRDRPERMELPEFPERWEVAALQ